MVQGIGFANFPPLLASLRFAQTPQRQASPVADRPARSNSASSHARVPEDQRPEPALANSASSSAGQSAEQGSPGATAPLGLQRWGRPPPENHRRPKRRPVEPRSDTSTARSPD